jgi:RNA recognition motif-containing protein
MLCLGAAVMRAVLFLQNLPPDADKLFLYEKFSPYGAILSVKVLKDPQSGQCRGVGFVNFAEHAAAVRSIQALHGTKVGDKLMHVSLQTPRIRASAVQC